MGPTELRGLPRAPHPPQNTPKWPWGPPRFDWSRFFCSLCVNTYSKVIQKRRIVKLLLGGTQVGYPLGGAPPGPLEPLQGSPGVTEF